MTPFGQWKFNIWQIVAFLLALVVLYFLACGRSKTDTAEKPIPSVPDQIVKVVKDSTSEKLLRDSFTVALNKSAVVSAFWKKGRDEALLKAQGISRDMDDLLSNPPAPSEYNTSLVEKFNDYKKQAAAKDQACDSVVTAQMAEIDAKDSLLAARDKLAADIRASLKTCFDNQTALEAKNKKVTPSKVQVYGGVFLIGNKTKWIDGYGAKLGVKLKNGLMFEAGPLQYAGQTNILVGVNKVFSFK